MKIKSIKLKNFRCYKDETVISFDDLTVFVGKNDAGKSTILQALDLFFNEGKGSVKFDKDDICKHGEPDGESEISVSFIDLPTSIIIDETNETALADEHLLNEDGELEILKKFSSGSTKPKVYVRAIHPQNPDCSDLLLKKQKDLQRQIKSLDIACEDNNRNAVMRKAIWNHYSDSLSLAQTLIDITKEDAKAIWTKLEEYIPLYFLFQSDRENTDADDEVQDPLRFAVKELLVDNQEIKDQLASVAEKVTEAMKTVAERTLSKAQELDPDMAKTLKPVIPEPQKLKWEDVFKSVSLSGDEDIPINKRGSGVKRLVLLSFFRAKAEEQQREQHKAGIIYAIEEPETSLHFSHQRMIAKAAKELATKPGIQVVLTTHSGCILKEMDFASVRLVGEKDGQHAVLQVEINILPYPSLNEIAFRAFDESTEEYHNELYGHIVIPKKDGKGEKLPDDFKSGKPTRPYVKDNRPSDPPAQLVLSEYVRNQIHHPNNTLNPRFTNQELHESIVAMRDYLQQHGVPNAES